ILDEPCKWKLSTGIVIKLNKILLSCPWQLPCMARGSMCVDHGKRIVRNGNARGLIGWSNCKLTAAVPALSSPAGNRPSPLVTPHGLKDLAATHGYASLS
ncbi:hypothetical protein KC19_9G186100, partial [Ceratodon purpureus]